MSKRAIWTGGPVKKKAPAAPVEEKVTEVSPPEEKTPAPKKKSASKKKAAVPTDTKKAVPESED